jgi:broad specificity phosphatase PhoE
MITIWFEPHSTTIDNEKQLASGWNDIDLSQAGIEQTFQPIKRSKERGIELIFCSDLQRAVKTAIPTAESLRVPIYIDKRLRECDYGKFTQESKKIIDQQKADRILEPFPGGESYEQCAERMGEFLDWLKANFDGKTIMIIGHRATQHGLEHHISGKSLLECVTEKWEYQPGWKYEL